MIDTTDLIGRQLTAIAERGQPRFFAGVLGETDPVYTDFARTREAGYPDLLIPPMFLFSLELTRLNPHGVLTELGVDMRQMFHGEQSFRYHSLATASIPPSGSSMVSGRRQPTCWAKRVRALP